MEGVKLSYKLSCFFILFFIIIIVIIIIIMDQNQNLIRAFEICVGLSSRL